MTVQFAKQGRPDPDGGSASPPSSEPHTETTAPDVLTVRPAMCHLGCHLKCVCEIVRRA